MGLDAFGDFNAVILAVTRREFAAIDARVIRAMCADKPVLLDIKEFWDKQTMVAAGIDLRRL